MDIISKKDEASKTTPTSPASTSTVGNKELSTWPTEGTKYLFQ